MDIIYEVKEDAQMLYDKRDVIELLERQRCEFISKSCRWLNSHAEEYISPRTPRCMEFGFLIEFEKVMKGE